MSPILDHVITRWIYCQLLYSVTASDSEGYVEQDCDNLQFVLRGETGRKASSVASSEGAPCSIENSAEDEIPYCDSIDSVNSLYNPYESFRIDKF